MSETQTRQEKIASKLAGIFNRSISMNEIESLVEQIFLKKIEISQKDFLSVQALFNYYPKPL